MDVLIAHRSDVSRQSLARALAGQGHRIIELGEGGDALGYLLAGDVPRVAVVDWDLPGIDGPELCRLVRDFHLENPPYVILLAAARHHHEVALGLQAGANDCVRTPVAADELCARVDMAERVVGLPWGRAREAEATADEDETGADGAGVGLRAVVYAEGLAPGDDAPGVASLDALLGESWQAV